MLAFEADTVKVESKRPGEPLVATGGLSRVDRGEFDEHILRMTKRLKETS
jgi:hypothetical protein